MVFGPYEASFWQTLSDPQAEQVCVPVLQTWLVPVQVLESWQVPATHWLFTQMCADP
jgi:hypothetical protein